MNTKWNLHDIRKKGVLLSLLFLLTGIIIGTAGLTMAGFDVNKLAENGRHKWYQTIQADHGALTFGVHFNDTCILYGAPVLPENGKPDTP